MTDKGIGRRIAAAALAITGLASWSCGGDAPDPGGTMFESVGDTTVARSGAVGEWGADAALVPEVSVGEMDGPAEELFGWVASIAAGDDLSVYVLDAQAQEVRVFDSAGAYVRTLGRRGEGPGELESGEAIALLPTGRLVVRDPANMRLQTYGPGDGETGEWAFNSGGWRTLEPLLADGMGRTYLSEQNRHLVLMDADGTHLDTLALPSSDFETPTLASEGQNMRLRYGVPMWPSFHWTVHSSGGFLTGLSTAYRLELGRGNGVLRIERDPDPVPVTDEDRTWHVERMERRMRYPDPGWTWNGPSIPDNQPPFASLHSGRGGRIWVLLPTVPRFADNPNYDEEDPYTVPLERLPPVRYDVFEADGTYLGAVNAPDGFATTPQPVFDGDRVWAVERDDAGIERVVRYRVEVGG